MRFTVHDSPDYHNIKVSVFNDDKKTDLIGEAWIPLWEVVITPGGGRADSWHNLSYRGKYAGEIRLELSYYDSRVPEKPATPSGSMRNKTPVKRRPLPAGPSPTVIPQFGPRALGCSRGTTVYLDDDGNRALPPPESFDEQSEFGESGYNSMQPDFLPQIPPRRGPRMSYGRDSTRSPASSAYQHGGSLSHSQSTPNFRSNLPARNSRQLYAEPEYTQPVYPDSGSYPGEGDWPETAIAPNHYDYQQQSEWDHDREFDLAELPPLPPSHNGTPQHRRRQSYDQQSVVSSASPLQTLERSYVGSSAASSRPVSEYQTPAKMQGNPSPLRRELPSPHSHAHPASGPVSPVGRSVGSSPVVPTQQSYLTHPPLNRQSVSDPYMTTPPRQQAHPLSQEVPRSTSPQPYHGNEGYEEPSRYHFPEDLPVVRPLPQTQAPRARHSIAAIRQPISAYAASHASSPIESRMVLAQPAERITPTRKEIGSRPTPPGSAMSRSSVPFSPDSFDAYNPAARASHLDAQPSPHSPYHIPAEPSRAASSKDTTRVELDPNKPIVDYHGRVVDPSDHLPVDSWAPEPESKTPPRAYAGGMHSFGPRSTQGTPNSGGASGGVSGPRKSNIVVNVRTRGLGDTPPLGSSPAPLSPPSPTRNRLVKKSSPTRASAAKPLSPAALREIAVPNPYVGYGGPDASQPPPKPPKIPLGDVDESQETYGYNTSALSREISKIDIGGIGGRRPPRGAAVGMRYHG